MKSSILLLLSVPIIAGMVYAGTNGEPQTGLVLKDNGSYVRPNIVFIMADDLGFSELGCYGGEALTPNLDQLAEQGVRFTNFHNAAKCEPTRAALMSGHRNTSQIGFYAERAESFLPAVMKENGYKTLMTGKWHVSRHPMDRGFEKFFGHEGGASNYWTGSGVIQLGREPYIPGEGYFSTDAFTDFAIQFLDESKQENDNQPFFLYLSYTAPHSPLQAHDEDIAKYRGNFLTGWHNIKQKRYQKLIELGLVPADIVPTQWPENLPHWSDLTDTQKDTEDYRMATYNAMIDRMDQNIGRVFDWLKVNNEWDNTLIVFISDNGADPFDRNSDKMVEQGILPGGPESNWSLGTAWAHVSNSPYRLYKRNMHEGGICAPMIMHWPKAGYEAGSITQLPVNVLDFLPTFHTLAGGEVRPPGIEGTDLSNLWTTGAHNRHYEMMGYLVDHRYIQQNKWKLVSVDGEPWELFDLNTDRNETNDLAGDFPGKAVEMEAAWDSWYYSFSNSPFLEVTEEQAIRRAQMHMGDKGTGVPYLPVAIPAELSKGWPLFYKLNLAGDSFKNFPDRKSAQE